MPLYVVSWTIDIEAGSAEEAARRALEIQRDPSSIATVFDVRRWVRAAQSVQVDLSPASATD